VKLLIIAALVIGMSPASTAVRQAQDAVDAAVVAVQRVIDGAP